MAVDPISAGSLVLGGLGLAQQSAAQRAQAGMLRHAARGLKDSNAYRKKIMARVDAWDPMAEAQAGIDFANDRAAAALGATLQREGYPSGARMGDTNAEIRKFNAWNDVLSPLQELQANVRSNAYAMKTRAMMDAIQTSDPGELSSGYANLAGAYQTDISGPMALLSQGIRGLTPMDRATTDAQATVRNRTSRNYSIGRPMEDFSRGPEERYKLPGFGKVGR